MNDPMSLDLIIISVSQNATKHTPKYGPHTSTAINSILVENEIIARFKEKTKLRDGDEFKVSALSNCNGFYLELLSSTSHSFIEMGANIGFKGTCTVCHLLEYQDRDKYEKRLHENKNRNDLVMISTDYTV